MRQLQRVQMGSAGVEWLCQRDVQSEQSQHGNGTAVEDPVAVGVVTALDHQCQQRERPERDQCNPEFDDSGEHVEHEHGRQREHDDTVVARVPLAAVPARPRRIESGAVGRLGHR